jgi:hypothetical protein
MRGGETLGLFRRDIGVSSAIGTIVQDRPRKQEIIM